MLYLPSYNRENGQFEYMSMQQGEYTTTNQMVWEILQQRLFYLGQCLSSEAF